MNTKVGQQQNLWIQKLITNIPLSLYVDLCWHQLKGYSCWCCVWTNICYILLRHTCQHRESPILRELHMLSWFLWSAQCARIRRTRYRGGSNPLGCSPGFQAGNGSISSLTLEYTHCFWMLLIYQTGHCPLRHKPLASASSYPWLPYGHLMESALDSVTSHSMLIWWYNPYMGAFQYLPGHPGQKESHMGMSSVLKLDCIEALWFGLLFPCNMIPWYSGTD